MTPRTFLRSSVAVFIGLALFGVSFALVPSPATARDGVRSEVTAKTSAPVDFRREVRPLLSDKCFECHGPDSGSRKAKLRLDTREGAFGDRKGGVAIVPGDVDASLVIERIRETHLDDRMPPPESNKELAPEEIDLLVRWVEQGAPWEDHWSFVPPQKPETPSVSDADWVRDPIDAFVLERLEGEKLTPSPEADRRTWIRRVTFDLTGLPPTLEDVRAFVEDSAPDAYEKVVDRLLGNSAYGEHMARYWLDATRYGDTHGLHLDNRRSIWPYRDWVVRSFNANQPFDQFTIEQLAGDLLENPTPEQQLATGFVRCNVTTNEGGSIVEEVYVRNVVDRTETIGTIYLGLTVGCAACHDHKFDPISQREFYELFAFFNSGTDNPMDGNREDHAPVIRVPTAEQKTKLGEFTDSIAAKEAFLAAPRPELDAAQAAWEKEWQARLAGQWETLATANNVSKGGATLTPQPDRSVLASGKNPERDRFTFTATTDMTDVIAVKLEALLDPSLPGGGPARVGHTNYVLHEFQVEAVSVADPSQTQKVDFVAAWGSYSQKNYHVSNAIDGDPKTGWAKDRRKQDHAALFFAREPFGFEGGTELRFGMDFEYGGQHVIGRYRVSITTDRENLETQFGPWSAAGLFPAASVGESFTRDFGPEAEFAESGRIDRARSHTVETKDGKSKKFEWKRNPELPDGTVHMLPGAIGATYLYRDVWSPSARRVTFSLGSDDGFKLWINGELAKERQVNRPCAADQEAVAVDLRPGANTLLLKISNHGGGHAFYFRKKEEDVGGLPIDLASILARDPADYTDADRAALREHYYAANASDWREAKTELATLRTEKTKLEGMVPVSLVMKEMAKPKPAFLLNRGEYDQKGDPVERRTPAVLPPFPEDAPVDRLGFARWLVDPAHPLTARVIVNRFWQQYFGVGLVKTAEDFGSQGEWPSHPELLDWLAVTFVESGWDVKALQRRIVLSATYRQSSKITEEQYKRDPENRLLARGPRFRLDAEVIRDSILALSGLLSPRMGGPGVKPYQPDGIWYAVGYTSSNTARFTRDSGESLYRRSLYTFWKRTAPPPTMQLFDAPTREACTVRRSRTNTPTAALGLMNDIQFVEAARSFAERVLQDEGTTDVDRLAHAFELATARRPDPREQSILERTLAEHRTKFEDDPDAAKQLIAVGESKPDASLDPAELAAWTLLSNLILNLHEVITKG